jgi:predicted methyltransferase
MRRLAALALGLVVGCGGGAAPPSAPTATSSAPPPADPSAAYRAIVDAPDRSADDRALDAGRHPAELLAFFGVTPGMKVAELGAGGGYTTELLARAVGPTGTVYGENPKVLLGFAGDAWTARLRKPAMAHVVRVDQELDAPLPAEATGLDACFIVLLYHDLFWMKVDRDKMLRAVFAALKPGGVFGVVDHSGKPGTGSTETQTVHRIEESVVVDEITKAGFTLAARGDFLRNPDDTRDWNPSPPTAGGRRGTSDRFVLKFVKPR